METTRLQYFCVIAETGSLTKASQMLGISQSGLSKAVAALEEEAKIKLFRPLGRGLEITEDGKWFYKKAQDILAIAAEITQKRKIVQAHTRIGLSSVLAVNCADLLVAEIDGPVTFREVDVGQMEGLILGAELDFAIGFVPSPAPELEYLKLGAVRLNAYAREDLLKKHSVDELPYALPFQDYPHNPMGYRNRDGWPVDLSRNGKFFVESFAVAWQLLRSGCAASYVPDFIAKTEKGLVKVKEHEKASSTRTLFLVKRQSAEESAPMKKAAKVFRRICV